MSCGHSHGPGQVCDHGPRVDEFDAGDSLYGAINLNEVRCLNERRPQSCQRVLRPFADKDNIIADDEKNSNILQSEQDEEPELLMHIPFTSPVQIRSITISGVTVSAPGAFPQSAKLIINKEGLDFSDAESLSGQQSLDLVVNGQEAEYPLKVHKFLNVSSLTILLKGSEACEFIQVDFLGLKGTSSEAKRQAVVAVYESRPMSSDHEVRADQYVPKTL
jgi:hypothetical protein